MLSASVEYGHRGVKDEKPKRRKKNYVKEGNWERGINAWSKVVAAPSCTEASIIQATGCACIEVAEADGAVEKRRAQKGNGNEQH